MICFIEIIILYNNENINDIINEIIKDKIQSNYFSRCLEFSKIATIYNRIIDINCNEEFGNKNIIESIIKMKYNIKNTNKIINFSIKNAPFC